MMPIRKVPPRLGAAAAVGAGAVDVVGAAPEVASAAVVGTVAAVAEGLVAFATVDLVLTPGAAGAQALASAPAAETVSASRNCRRFIFVIALKPNRLAGDHLCSRPSGRIKG